MRSIQLKATHYCPHAEQQHNSLRMKVHTTGVSGAKISTERAREMIQNKDHIFHTISTLAMNGWQQSVTMPILSMDGAKTEVKVESESLICITMIFYS